MKSFLSLPILLLSMGLCMNCGNKASTLAYESETLKVEQVAANTYIHTTWLQTETFGLVPCNGMIVTSEGEALVFDTPANDKDSRELIGVIQTKLKCKPVGIVVTHFHTDCLGGLNEFHSTNIPSYANNLTIELAASRNNPLPQNGFDSLLVLRLGNEHIINQFIGEGHTRDNIVSYHASDKTLFGGCLIKEVGAGKGNLEDANVDMWPTTIENVRSLFPDAKVVIPGHGKPGGQELLDYTIELFKQ